MQNFVKGFVRERDGAWLCIEPVELKLDSGRIQVAAGARFTRGTRYMGIDLAQFLDQHYEKTPPSS